MSVCISKFFSLKIFANESSYVLLDSSISSSDSSAPEINLSSPLFVLTAVRFLLSLSESSCVTLVLWVSINESENIKATTVNPLYNDAVCSQMI